MSNLLDYVNDARPYRILWSAQAMARRYALVCHPNHVDQALTWFVTKHGKTVDFLVLDIPAARAGATQIIPMAALRENPDINVIVFGPGERKIAMRLAEEGCRYFSFAFDPVYKHFKYDPDYLRQNRGQLEKAFGLLEDEESRLTLASVVKQRITSDHGHLRIARYGLT